MKIDSQTLQNLLGLFQPGTTVALAGHINPDGDSLGSMLALEAWLQTRGCSVTKLLANKASVPAAYGFLAQADLNLNFVAAEDYRVSPDVFVAVDLSQTFRLGQALSVLERAGHVVVIDHHPEPEGFAEIMLHDETVAAAGMLVWQLLNRLQIDITAGMATACYVALLTDTGRFSYQNTTAQVLEAASQMVSAGAAVYDAAQAIYGSRSLASLKLDSLLVDRIEYLVNRSVVCSWLTAADFDRLGVAGDETEDLVGILRSVADTELAVLLRQNDRQVRVNLRARGDYDCAKLARDHGGGGHRAAAGFNFAGSLDQTREAIRHYLLSEGLL